MILELVSLVLFTGWIVCMEFTHERSFPKGTIGYFIVMLFALFCMTANAQNSRFDYSALTVTGVGDLVPVLAMPGSKVSFYTGCTSLPCSTYANVYNTVSSSTACPTNAQIVLNSTSSCVSTADGQGNFGGWFLPGQYQYVITAFNNIYGPYSFTIGYNSGSFSFPISIANGGTGQTTGI